MIKVPSNPKEKTRTCSSSKCKHITHTLWAKYTKTKPGKIVSIFYFYEISTLRGGTGLLSDKNWLNFVSMIYVSAPINGFHSKMAQADPLAVHCFRWLAKEALGQHLKKN